MAGCKPSGVTVNPPSLIFETEEGSRFVPPSQSLFLGKKRPGGYPARWEIFTSEDWLRVRPSRGSGKKKVRVSVKSRDMAADIYNAKIKVGPNIAVIPVKLIIRGDEIEPQPEGELIKCPNCGAALRKEVICS